MNVAEWDRQHLWRFRARLFRPVDGDTFVAMPDCGFRIAGMPHIRILDFWAPELRQEGGLEARARLAVALTEWEGVHDWPIRIESKIRERVVTETTSFERYIATVWVVDGSGEMTDVREVVGA